MSKEHGNLSINSQNIFPIIKKWMYSDHDIFYRELVSNACDAITKLKKLSMIGEYEAPDDIEYKVEIKLSAKSGDVFEQVARDLADIPEVLECHLISGEFDYLVKARLKEMSAYRKLLGNILKKLPASASSHSYVVMEEVKESSYLDLSV